jgi:predicted PurR-regulated permease PerM
VVTEPRTGDSGAVQRVLAVLTILGLIAFSLLILRPFLGAIIWAATIVSATWPLLLAVQRRLWGRRGLAVAAFSLCLLAFLFIPFLLSIGTIVSNVDEISAWMKSLSTFHVPPLPDWIAGIPFVGPSIVKTWEKVLGAGLKDLAALAAPYAGDATQWIVKRLGSVGFAIAQFMLTVVVSALFWSKGEDYAAMIRRYARRLAGDRGGNAVVLAGQAVRGVALGVVVTALVQAALGGIGLLVVGIPFAAILTAVMFLFCIAQLGPLLVLLPAVMWVFWSGNTGWGIFLLVWTLIVGALDNFLRPVLIRKGADLPLVLIFAGVLGGLMTMGLIGIFVGPVVLAVTRALGEAWVIAEPESA